MQGRTVKVSNVSLRATEKEIKEFFSFSGNIEYVEIQSVNEKSKVPFVTFKNPQGADTAVLLTGATVVDQAVTVTLATDYKLPATASTTSNTPGSPHGSAAVQKAEDVVTTMLAKGFILGKGALNRAKSFDDKHQFTSTATAKAASLDQKIGLTEKISIGATIVNDKAKEMDEKYQVSDKTKTAFAVAEQKVSTASSKIMKNPYVMTGAMWVTGALSTVSKAAAELQEKTKKKLAEEEKSQSKSKSQPDAEKNVQEVVSRDCTQKLEAYPQSQLAAEKNVQDAVNTDCTQKLEAHPQTQPAAEKNVQEVVNKDCTQKLEAHPQTQPAAEKNVQELVNKDCTQKLEAHPQTQPAAEKNVQEVVNKDCTQKLETHHDSHNSSSGSPSKAAATATAAAAAAAAPESAPAPTPAPAEVPAPKADHASKP